MSMIVIMPGGFHPFHAGHFALYQSAKKKFPGADLYVAATNDMSERPFPFQLKEKLAKLAGVEPGHFIQVKSPFQAKEITQNYDPDKDVLVFVRSEKDRNEPPKPGGTKKDGSPAYFQPWTGKNLQPFSKHAYIEYLPTVEFGPGITSATQIRKAWPTLNDKRKLALVMSLYPATQKNPKLAQTVVGMFDQVMGGQLNETSGHEYILYINDKPAAKYNDFRQAERDVELIKQKHPTSKFEIKKEVCNMVSVPIGLKEAIFKGLGITEQTNPRVDLTPNFPNYSKLVGEYLGAQGNKLQFQIVDAVLKPGVKASEKIAKAIANNRPIVMAPHYVKNRKVVSEFATNNNGDDDNEDFFFNMAKQWWLGNEQQMVQVVNMLDKLGYEIGEDNGYDDGGVFIVKSGDQNGSTYMSWSHEDLSGLNEAASAAQQAAIAINMKKQGKKPKTNESVDYLEEK